MNKINSVNEELSIILNEYLFNIETFSEYLDLEKCETETLLRGDMSILPEDDKAKLIIFNKINLLYEAIKNDADTIIKENLKVLVSYHNISKNTIAKAANVDAKDIDKLLSDKGYLVDDNKKYRLTAMSMALRFCLKDIESKSEL